MGIIMRFPRRWFPPLAVAMALASAGMPHAQALLTYDLEVTSLNGEAPTGDNTPKTLTVTTGDVLAFQIFARVTGAAGNPGLEGFTHGYFGLGSSLGGGIEVNCNGPITLHPLFADAGSQTGTPFDRDGDGDLDLGTTDAVPNTTLLRPVAAITVTDGTPILNGTQFELGKGHFTIGTTTPASTVTVNAIIPGGTFNVRAQWQEDGVGRFGFLSLMSTGVPITLSTAVPEPGSALFLMLGTIGLLGRRRRR